MTWIWRALWLMTVVTTAEVVAIGAHDRSVPVRLAVTIGAWAVWGAGLAASLVPLPSTLTAIRLLAPLPVVAVAWAATVADPFEPGILGVIGIVVAVAVAVVACSGDLGVDFVSGAGYGDERRLPLRPPGALLLGPIQLTWAAAVLLPTAAVLLLAARLWVAGAVISVVGVAAALVGVRALHRLAGRWAVLVPAGLTLVDPLALVDPVLLARTNVRRLGPATTAEEAVDLTLAAPGLMLRVDLEEPVQLSRMRGRADATPPEPVRAVIFAPSRPGRLLAEAEGRRLRVARA